MSRRRCRNWEANCSVFLMGPIARPLAMVDGCNGACCTKLVRTSLCPALSTCGASPGRGYRPARGS
eukprot:395397-Lingulodinium_polyedra.AAC.1